MLKWSERELQIRISKRSARTRKKRTNQCAQRCVCIYEMYRGLKTEKNSKASDTTNRNVTAKKKHTTKTNKRGKKDRPHNSAHYKQLRNVTFQLRLGRLKIITSSWAAKLHKYTRLRHIQYLQCVNINQSAHDKEKA